MIGSFGKISLEMVCLAVSFRSLPTFPSHPFGFGEFLSKERVQHGLRGSLAQVDCCSEVFQPELLSTGAVDVETGVTCTMSTM